MDSSPESLPNELADSGGASNARYVVVARRYRPQSFEELVGQQQVTQALHNAIATNRVGHAYLFTGARGVGKTTTARILAKCLNCQSGPTSTPCNSCDICQAVSSGEDVDVLEIDGASNRGIDEIRQLRSNVNIRPSRCRFKIYIIDEVHMLTNQAFNALLKTLEEPPEHVKFIFCTTDPEKIPITVLSRCQRFDFPPVESDRILERLEFIVKNEGREAEPEALELLARRAMGSMRDSQSLLEQVLSFGGEKITADDVHRMLGAARSGKVAELAKRLLDRDAAGALIELDASLGEGVDAGQLGAQLLGYYRDLITASVGCPPELLLHCSADDHPELARRGAEAGAASLLAAAQILDQTLVLMRQSTHVRTLLEVAVVRICQLEELDDVAQMVAHLRETAGSAKEAPKTKAPPPPERQKKTPEPVKPAETEPSGEPNRLPLDANSIPGYWSQALSKLEDMTRDFAGYYDRIAISGPNRLVVMFKASYNLQKESCERPDRRAKIESALSQVCGGPVKVEFQLLDEPNSESTPRKPAPNRRQQMRAKESHPLVSEAIEIFDAEMIRLEQGKKRSDSSDG